MIIVDFSKINSSEVTKMKGEEVGKLPDKILILFKKLYHYLKVIFENIPKTPK